jgi:hypothetical protein
LSAYDGTYYKQENAYERFVLHTGWFLRIKKTTKETFYLTKSHSKINNEFSYLLQVNFKQSYYLP